MNPKEEKEEKEFPVLLLKKKKQSHLSWNLTFCTRTSQFFSFQLHVSTEFKLKQLSI